MSPENLCPSFYIPGKVKKTDITETDNKYPFYLSC